MTVRRANEAERDEIGAGGHVAGAGGISGNGLAGAAAVFGGMLQEGGVSVSGDAAKK